MRKNRKRFLYMILVGIGVSILLHVLLPFPSNNHHNRLFDYITSVVITIFVWEGNLRLDHLLNEKYPWIKNPGKRLFSQFLIAMMYSAMTIFLLMMVFNKYICEIPVANKMALVLTSTIIGVMVSFIILSVEISMQFFSQWKSSIVEIEKHKKETIQAQLENLKSQVNPHFLFNNLSVLSSLVYKDQDKAVEFINQLSKVYRYVLDSKERELVAVETEMEFIRSYCYLLIIRFDDSLKFQFDIPEETNEKLIPPMALQLLIENTIKHNETSTEQPLLVSVKVEGDSLVVRNNLQLRKKYETSSETGLNNIIKRYRHYTDRPVEIKNDGSYFEVKIPLLNSDEIIIH